MAAPLFDLGGASAYLGENLRSPAALDSALVTSMVAMALGVIHGALLSAAAWTLRMQPGIEISRSSNDDVNYLAIDGAADRLDFAETYLVA